LLASLAFALAAIALGLWTAPRWLVPWIASRSPRCLYAVPTHEKVVALTFDDGPDRTSSPEILRLLREHDARATFFFISGNVSGAEHIVADAVAQGNELGNHLTRDEPSIRLSPSAFVAAIREAGAVLSGFGPVLWLRPGSAWYNDAMLDAIEREGYRCVLGSVYPYDPYVPIVRLTSAYILANTRPGSVIVLHEGGARGARTVEVLGRVLPALHKRGYRVVTLSELATVGYTTYGDCP
jgi:peptidoglycan/xylan/chitin deacetylase (PgdA/CDA1 family)